jgi:hypothetical protein
MPPSLLLDSLSHIYHLANEWGISPVIAGGLAVSYWGHPRSTRDIDLAVLVTSQENFERQLRIAGLVPSKGAHHVKLGFVQVSQWRMAVRDAYIDIDIDFLISPHPYHNQAIQRALACEMPGCQVPMRVLACEDLLLFKAKSGRMIDLADIDVLMTLHGDRLDRAYLQEKSQEIGLDPSRWAPAA